jgi:uncharacterized Zn finger protein
MKKCPNYEDGKHQWAVIRADPPLSECQNCGKLSPVLRGHYKQ